MLRTMRGEADDEFQGEWSESDSEFSPFARQLTITKAKRLIRRHTKKFRSRGQKGLRERLLIIYYLLTWMIIFMGMGFFPEDLTYHITCLHTTQKLIHRSSPLFIYQVHPRSTESRRIPHLHRRS